MRKGQLLFAELVGGILTVLVLSCLGFIALTEKSISLGSRFGGVTQHTGNNAVWCGLFLIAFSLLVLGYLTRFTRHKVLYWGLLSAVCLGLVAWQVTAGF